MEEFKVTVENDADIGKAVLDHGELLKVGESLKLTFSGHANGHAILRCGESIVECSFVNGE